MYAAAEVGMLQALLEAGVEPDLILGTSIGALNGAVIAAHPGEEGVERLHRLWSKLAASPVPGGSSLRTLTSLARSKTHVQGNESLALLTRKALGFGDFDELTTEFQCVAASVERATGRWFDSGPLVEAILASCAIPGLLPPVELDGEHFFDGGLIHSIPIGRAVELGATTIFVLQVGGIEEALISPANAWEVGAVAFEISRRHRALDELKMVPEDVAMHVLPTGDPVPPPAEPSRLLLSDTSQTKTRISRAREATISYLATMPANGRTADAGGI